MASTPLPLILLTLIPILFLLTPQTQAQTAPAEAPAGPVNLTAILEKGGQYTTFIRLLNETQQISQIANQLNSTSEGFSVFGPTDNAFQNLKAGVINDLSDQQKVQLLLYHVTPEYYTLTQLLTVSNPVRSQASGAEGSWGLNFTGQGNQVNVSTGVVTTQINNALRQQFPLAVYQVDKVLLPSELFGATSPASAPAPKKAGTPPGKSSDSNSSDGAPSSRSTNEPGDAPARNVGLGLLVGLGLICMGALS